MTPFRHLLERLLNSHAPRELLVQDVLLLQHDKAQYRTRSVKNNLFPALVHPKVVSGHLQGRLTLIVPGQKNEYDTVLARVVSLCYSLANMENALAELQRVQYSIAARNQPDCSEEASEKLLFCPVGSLLHVEFYGLPFEESFGEFVDILCSPQVAHHIRSLVFRGPDEGANGTRNWDFSALIQSDETLFSHLLSLVVESTLPEHHNQTIIGAGYEEDGQVGRLLTMSSALQRLSVPSAPDATFFHRGVHPLTSLQVDAGYDTQDFILNFSQSSCFPRLRTLDFGDYNQRSMEDYPNGCVPFEHYRQLFRSEAFSHLSRFILRNATLSATQLKELHELRKECQFLVIQTPQGHYIQ